MGSCLGWLQVHTINGLKICKSKELRVCCTHSPKTKAKMSVFSWLSFVDVKRSLCTTHNWWQRNEQRPKNERSKVFLKHFLHFQVDASCILTWTSKLWARNNLNPFHFVGCNPVEKPVLICKPRPPGLNNTGYSDPRLNECSSWGS